MFLNEPNVCLSVFGRFKLSIVYFLKFQAEQEPPKIVSLQWFAGFRFFKISFSYIKKNMNHQSPGPEKHATSYNPRKLQTKRWFPSSVKISWNWRGSRQNSGAMLASGWCNSAIFAVCHEKQPSYFPLNPGCLIMKESQNPYLTG